MLSLVFFPDERLQQESAPIVNINDDVLRYCDQMIETMHEERGIGLAAVQTGRMENMFVVHVSDDKPRVFINPEIINFSEEHAVYSEGCLSIPGVSADVSRPEAVQVRAIGRNGREFSLEAGGMLSRAIQHEYDHLQGKLFYEYLKPGQQRRLIKAYNNFHEDTFRG